MSFSVLATRRDSVFYDEPLPPCMLSVTSGEVRWSGGQMLTLGLVVAIVVVLGSLVFAPDGIPSLVALKRERQRLGEQAVALLEQNTALREQVDRLRTDDRFLEGLARRELGFVRSDELVYRFRRPPKTAGR
jgi:cell division protein FtsB